MSQLTPVMMRTAAWLLALGIIIADQATKFFIRTELVPGWEDKINVLPVFNLVHYWNKGVAFSMFSSGPLSGPWLMIGISLVVTLVVVAWLMSAWRLRPALAYGAIIGGALGNIIDRLIFGQVFDFLEFHWGMSYFPAFNLADTAIFLGVACLFLDMFLERPALPKDEE